MEISTIHYNQKVIKFDRTASAANNFDLMVVKNSWTGPSVVKSFPPRLERI
jgi:hypothetical protein